MLHHACALRAPTWVKQVSVPITASLWDDWGGNQVATDADSAAYSASLPRTVEQAGHGRVVVPSQQN